MKSGKGVKGLKGMKDILHGWKHYDKVLSRSKHVLEKQFSF